LKAKKFKREIRRREYATENFEAKTYVEKRNSELIFDSDSESTSESDSQNNSGNIDDDSLLNVLNSDEDIRFYFR